MPEGEDEGDAAETSSRPGSGRTKRSSWTCRRGAGTAMAAANTATRLGIWRRRRAGERARGRARWRGYGVGRAAEGGGAREGVARGDRSGSGEGGTKGSVELAMAHPSAVRHK